MERVDLFASGREALRVALEREAALRGRDEVVVGAYTCYSVPAAAVAAGLRVRLVDVTPEGWLDPDALERSGLERAAAVVASNLFGNPEPVAALRERARSAGAALIDDAAQALGAADAEGAVGGRGDVGLLSFARGKPLPAGGGGGLAWREAPSDLAPPALPRPSVGWGWAWALAHDVARSPWVFGWVAALPGLHVGETRFDPGFRRGPPPRHSLALAAALLPRLEDLHAELRRRAAELAARIRDETPFRPVLEPSGTTPVRPRLALRAPSAAARRAALAALERRGMGASALYPDSLDRVAALAPHRSDAKPCPGARDLATRLLTLPPDLEARSRRADALVRVLQQAGADPSAAG